MAKHSGYIHTLIAVAHHYNGTHDLVYKNVDEGIAIHFNASTASIDLICALDDSIVATMKKLF